MQFDVKDTRKYYISYNILILPCYGELYKAKVQHIKSFFKIPSDIELSWKLQHSIERCCYPPLQRSPRKASPCAPSMSKVNMVLLSNILLQGPYFLDVIEVSHVDRYCTCTRHLHVRLSGTILCNLKMCLLLLKISLEFPITNWIKQKQYCWFSSSRKGMTHKITNALAQHLKVVFIFC